MRWGKVHISPFTPPLLVLFAFLVSPVLLAALLSAAALHELGHIAALRYYGGRISCLAITPFGAEMTVSDSTQLSYGAEMLVTLAGPAVNLLLALGLGLLGKYGETFYVFAGAQLVLGLFNLIPARPLDGGQLLWLVMAWLCEPFTADRVTAAVSVVFSLAISACGAAVLYRTGKSPFLLLGSIGLLTASLRELGLVKFSRTG